MRRAFPVAGAIALATGLVVGTAALPSGAQTVEQDVEVTGEVRCDTSPGAVGWWITWTISNTTEVPVTTTTTVGEPDPSPPTTLVGPPEPFAVAIGFASMSGAWSGPLPIIPGFQLRAGSAIANLQGPVPNSAVGDVILTVSWSGEFAEGPSTATVTLDGSCVAPAGTPGPDVADTVVAQPSLTG